MASHGPCFRTYHDRIYRFAHSILPDSNMNPRRPRTLAARLMRASSYPVRSERTSSYPGRISSGWPTAAP